ncbi:immunoglobulin-like domain-containing protein [Listeria goaensis]|uniref:immunoglobulin-like domain-containing protein n=1 Tax=Listeria goaensis TaxID=1649188 RepID=UPI000B593480
MKKRYYLGLVFFCTTSLVALPIANQVSAETSHAENIIQTTSETEKTNLLENTEFMNTTGWTGWRKEGEDKVKQSFVGINFNQDGSMKMIPETLRKDGVYENHHLQQTFETEPGKVYELKADAENINIQFVDGGIYAPNTTPTIIPQETKDGKIQFRAMSEETTINITTEGTGSSLEGTVSNLSVTRADVAPITVNPVNSSSTEITGTGEPGETVILTPAPSSKETFSSEYAEMESWQKSSQSEARATVDESGHFSMMLPSKLPANFSFYVNYAAFSDDGSVTPLDVNGDGSVETSPLVTVIQNEAPVISGVEDETVASGSEINLKENVTAYDKEDGDLTDKIEISEAVDTSKAGDYVVQYKVSDNDKNVTTATSEVHVVDSAQADKEGSKPEEVTEENSKKQATYSSENTSPNNESPLSDSDAQEETNLTLPQTGDDKEGAYVLAGAAFVYGAWKLSRRKL